MTSTMAVAPQPIQFDEAHSRTTLWHVIRSEWIKFSSVRSTRWALVILFVATVGISVLITWAASSNYSQMSPKQHATFDVVGVALSGITLGQLAIAVLGTLIISAEYSTGGIRTTLTAVPSRMRVLTAKGLILAVVSLVVGLIASFVSFFASMPFWNHLHLEANLSDPGVARAVIGGGLYIMASALFGFALGTLLRHTAGAITVAVAFLFVLPPVLGALPASWGHTIYKYFTSNAGSRIGSVVADPTVLSPWVGYLVYTIWWVVPLIAGAWLMRRRDT